MDKIMSSGDKNVGVVYENHYSIDNGSVAQMTDIVKEYGGGVYSANQDLIVIAPSVGAVSVDILNTSTNSSGTLVPTGFSSATVQQNTTSTLFHEFGEVNAPSTEYRGDVIQYENLIRKVIGLPKRPQDLNHSNIIPTKYGK